MRVLVRYAFPTGKVVEYTIDYGNKAHRATFARDAKDALLQGCKVTTVAVKKQHQQVTTTHTEGNDAHC